MTGKYTWTQNPWSMGSLWFIGLEHCTGDWQSGFEKNATFITHLPQIFQQQHANVPSTVSFPTVLWSPILAEYSAPSSNTDFSIVRVCSAPSSFIWMRLSGLVIFLPFLNHWTLSGLEVAHLKVTLSPSGIVKSLRGVIKVTGKAANHIYM